MTHPTRLARTLLAILVAIPLAACGGAGGGGLSTGATGLGTPAVGPDTQFGHLARIEGLAYETPTHRGFTGPDGVFPYEPGENVTFSLGDFPVGQSVPAASSLTVSDLVAESYLPVSVHDVRRFLRGLTGESDLLEAGQGALYAIHEPTRRMLGLLVVLASLDSDKDGINGVTIGAGVGSLLQGQTIDLDAVVWDGSRSNLGELLHNLRYEALERGNILNAHPVSWATALDEYATAIGLRPLVYVLSSYEEDSGNDGSVDSRVIRGYDDANLISTATDRDGDGNPEQIRSFAHNDHGDILRSMWDVDGDGRDDTRASTYYDAHGSPTHGEIDVDADGSVDGVVRWTNDTRGRSVLYESDRDLDGAADAIQAWARDAAGHVLRYENDYKGDGVVDQVFEYEYDANGRVIQSSVDNSGDGVADRVTTTVYDRDGNKINIATDSDNDGDLDFVEERGIDGDGRVAVIARDRDGDGTIDEFVRYTYDAQSRRISARYDRDGNGTADQTDTWTHDAEGRIVRATTDSNGGSYQQVYEYEYDSHGSLIQRKRFLDGGARLMETTIWTYDDDGNWTGRVGTSALSGYEWAETATHALRNFRAWLSAQP